MTKSTLMCDYDSMADAMVPVMQDVKRVRDTQGPSGRYFLLPSEYGSPRITKDGYTVIKAMEYDDELRKTLFKVIKDNVEKTNKEAGDGTTYCASVMAEAFLGLNKLRISGTNILDIKAGYEFTIEKIHALLAKMAKKIDIKSIEIEQIATISANDDATVGKMIAEAMRLVGAEGVITVEESKSSEMISYEHKSGMHLDRGYISPYFSTNNEKMICEMEDPYILITSKKITNISNIIKLLEGSAKNGRPLFIIAEDVEGEALSTLIINRLRGVIKVCAIKAPGFGDKRTEMLKDIAILVGGEVICDETGLKIEEVELDSGLIGSAKRVTVTKDSTIIVHGAGDKAMLDARTNLIKNQIAECSSEYDKEKLQERLAKLSGGVAVIKVGGHTEVEVKELKDRVEDALNATRAAVAEGIVPGGGVTQLAIAYILRKVIHDSNLNSDAKAVANKILEAFASSIQSIVDNSGYHAKVIMHELEKSFDKDKISMDNVKISQVYNALTNEYVDPYKAGIIDPAKVIKVAFTNAISCIYLLLRCEGAVYFVKEEKAASGGGAGGMGGMGGMDGMY